MVHIFIINPYSGSQIFADDLRQKLAQYKDLKYFVFNTRHAGDETELVRRVLRFFDDEKVRFYCCGGTGTLCNLINGIDNLLDVEIAFYPCGLSNDFLKCFGKYEVHFYELDKLIAGSARKIDYIKTNNGVALNAISVGFDQSILAKVDEYRSLSLFGKNMPYIIGLVHGLFLTRANSYAIYADGLQYEGKCAQIVFANGCSIGGKFSLEPSCDILDGKGRYSVCPSLGWRKLHGFVRTIAKKRYDRYEEFSKMGYSGDITIRRTDGKNFQVDLDGEIQEPCSEWHAEIVNEGLNFVFPKGVTLDER